MTLNEAQKKYPDAIRIKIQFVKGETMTESEAIDFLKRIAYCKKESKVLFFKLGKTYATGILSVLALHEEYFKNKMTPGKKVELTDPYMKREYTNIFYNITSGPVIMNDEWCVYINDFSQAVPCRLLKLVD